MKDVRAKIFAAKSSWKIRQKCHSGISKGRQTSRVGGLYGCWGAIYIGICPPLVVCVCCDEK